MEHSHITNDGRSISEDGTWRNPCGEEKRRTTNEKMKRHVGVNRSSTYKKRRRRNIYIYIYNVLLRQELADQL
jgi:hypothetical protein